jgi:hypothetical protein
MPSTLTNISNTINNNFPPLGKRTMGVNEFHSNFEKIQNSFEILSSEIDSIETKNIKKNSANNFGNSIITNAIFTNTSYIVYNIGLIGTGITNIDYSQGMYQICSTKGGSILFNLTNASPFNSIGKLRLEISNETTSTTATCLINFSGNTIFLGSRRVKYNIVGSSKLFFDILPFDNNSEKYFVKCLGSDTELFTGTDFPFLFLRKKLEDPSRDKNAVLPNPPNSKDYVPPAGWERRTMTYEQVKQFSFDAAIIIAFVTEGKTVENALSYTGIQFYDPPLWKTVALNLAKSYRPGYTELDQSFPACIYDTSYGFFWVWAPPEFNVDYNPINDPNNYVRPPERTDDSSIISSQDYIDEERRKSLA